jgi:hypothetical protein
VKFQLPNFTVLAAVAYALFATFGLAVWYTLLFTEVPQGASAWSTAQELLQAEPQARLLQAHAAATLIAVVFSAVLLLRPAAGSPAYLAAAITAIVFAVLAWLVFSSDTAILPSVAAIALAFGWFKSKPQIKW